jgi:Ca2+-binding RTX toxin-like protein
LYAQPVPGRVTAVCALGAAVLAVAPPALAGTASVSGNTIGYAAAAGEANDVTVTATAVDPALVVEVRDAGASVTAGPGCLAVDANAASCTVAVPLEDAKVLVEAGDLADMLSAAPFCTGCGAVDHLTLFVLDGGAGDDVLVTGRGADRLAGGSGDDVLRGGKGADWLEGERGDDRIFGGWGDDQIAGGDMRGSGFGGRREGRVPDRAGADTIDAGRGNDLVFAHGGPDHILGGAGNDFLFGHRGRDVIDGGMAADILDACDREADRVLGGDGYDVAAIDFRVDVTRRVRDFVDCADGGF